ncbi:hypothetical protein BDW75DRAFT_236515 [Aspergillus navahoensis]
MSGSTPIRVSSIKKNVKKAYDSISVTYSAWTKPHHATRIRYLNILLDHLTPDASRPNDVNQESKQELVLELGCGSGDPVTTTLASIQHPANETSIGNLTPRFKVIGNDISPQQLKMASETLDHHKNVELREGDMMELTFEDATLDAVLGMYALIHVPRQQQDILLRNIHTWLKPGGYFLGNFAVEELESVFDDMWLGCGVNGGIMFWSSWGKEKTCEIMAEIGFEIVLKEVVDEIEDDDGKETEVPFVWVLARKKLDI